MRDAMKEDSKWAFVAEQLGVGDKDREDFLQHVKLNLALKN